MGRDVKRGLEVRNGTGSGVAERTKRRRCWPLEVERVVETGEIKVVDSGGDEGEVIRSGGVASTRTSCHPSTAFCTNTKACRLSDQVIHTKLSYLVESLLTSKILMGKASKNSLAITNVCMSSSAFSS
jgi:hypothetical protein